MMMHRFASVCLILLLLASTACGQNPKPSPKFRNVAYDTQHASQVLDVYLPETSSAPLPTMIYIHGGGWRGGSKNSVPAWLMDAVTSGWLNVVSVEYRFTNVAEHPAQVNDCLRAVQFVREHAAEWNVDPKRLGVTGGSAGGHLSLYVALHDDIAQASAIDPIVKQSSRVACAVSFAGPTDWSLLSSIDHKHPAYRQLLGYDPKTEAGQMDEAKKKDVSPISFVSADDPPVLQVHGDKDDIVPIEHAQALDRILKEAKVRSELVVIPGANHGVAGASANVSDRAISFTREVLSK